MILYDTDIMLYNANRADATRFGRRGFSVAGPAIWNSLPQEVRQAMIYVELLRKS